MISNGLLLLLFFISCLHSLKGDGQGEPIPASAFSVHFADKNVVLCKDPQMFFLLEDKRPNDNQSEKCLLSIGSRTATHYWVEDMGNYKYIIHSPSSKISRPSNNAVNVCHIQVTGTEMSVPIGGYPNFNESSMNAKLCLMNGSVCQPVSSYHNGLSSRNKYKGRIDFNNETGQFYLLNATESDNGTYRYTVTVVQDQNSTPVPNTYTLHLRIGVCSEDNSGNNTGLIVGVVVVVLLIGLFCAYKGTKSKPKKKEVKNSCKPTDIRERSLLVDKKPATSRRRPHRKTKTGAAPK